MSQPESAKPELMQEVEAVPPAPPVGASPEELEKHWLDHVYAGDSVPQLTVRAVLTGMVLGGVMALSNLYVVLKTGWSLGVTITAAILGFTFWRAVQAAAPKVSHFGILENNAMQSVASAAGFMTGGGTAAAIPALMLTTGYKFDHLSMFVWIATLAFLGVFVAIPLKRQMINVEQLRFPSGIAAAETVKSLHAKGRDSIIKARALYISAALGGILALMRDRLELFADKLPAFGSWAAKRTLSLELSLIMVGAGAIMGMRVAMSQLAGSLICYLVGVSWAQQEGAITGPLSFKVIVGWSVWFGSSMMLTAGLLHFALSWKQVKRAFADIGGLLVPKKATAVVDPLARIEVPSSWFAAGVLAFGSGAAFLQWYLFDIPGWMGVLTVFMSLVIGIVAARSTGETDTTPSGAMGKIVQLTFGALHPGNMTTNLMTAQASAGVAIHSSDLLTDLKSGYILGAKPRQQFLAQFFGVIAGSLVVVPVYLLLVNDVSVIGTKFDAPAAQSWAAVAKLLAKGLDVLHWTARWEVVVGASLGVVLVLLEKFFPRHKKFIPSPMAFGLAFTMGGYNAISMAIGATAAYVIEKKRPALAALFVITVSSGLIAGESLFGAFNGIAAAIWK